MSADDRLVAVYTFCGLVRVGRVADARPFESFNQHGQLSSAAFNPAGDKLALGSWDDSVTVLNVATDKPGLELVGHTRGVNGVVYSARGEYIISTSTDDTMRVWNSATGQLLQVDHDLSAPGSPSVSPDGALVAETNNDDQVRLWAVCPECQDSTGLLKASRSSVVSPLTPLERAEVTSQAGMRAPAATLSSAVCPDWRPSSDPSVSAVLIRPTIATSTRRRRVSDGAIAQPVRAQH